MMEELHAGLGVAMDRNHPCQNNVWLESHSQEQEVEPGSAPEARRKPTGKNKPLPSVLHSLPLLPTTGRSSFGSSQQSRKEIYKILAPAPQGTVWS